MIDTLISSLNYSTLLMCATGVIIGMIVGVLPGIGAFTAMALLLPMTYNMDLLPALIMFGGIWYGSMYGGSITSIVTNVPGTPSTIMSCLDGYPMAQKGKAGVALILTAVSSFVGGIIGILMLIWFGPAIGDLGLTFHSADYASLMLFGLVLTALVIDSNIAKSLSMVLLGFLVSTIGADMFTGEVRYDTGIAALEDGINIVVLIIGLFGVSEIIDQMGSRAADSSVRNIGSLFPSLNDWRNSILPTLRGTAIGAVFGALPGTGPSAAGAVSYMTEKILSKNKNEFGNGSVAGVVAPEAANNSAAQTAFIPTLTLGIPGDAGMILILSLFMIHGVAIGPGFITNNPDIFWGLTASFIIGNVILLIVNVPLVKVWVYLLRIPFWIIAPSVLTFAAVGAYSLRNNILDIFLVGILGVVGYLLKKMHFSAVPLLMGCLLGPGFEDNLRRSLVLSDGSFAVFVNRPWSASFVAATAILLVYYTWKQAHK